MPLHKEATSSAVAADCRTWAPADQERWIEAFDPALNPGLPRWSRPAQYQNAGVFTRYLACAAEAGLEPLVSPAGLQAFITKCQSRDCSPITITGYTWAIWKVLKILRPDQHEDFAWLKQTCCRLQKHSKEAAKRRKHRKVESAELDLIGERLIEDARVDAGRDFLEAVPEALIGRRPSWQVVQRYRDGLFILIGANAPERLRALTSIQVNQIDLRAGTISFGSSQIKTKRAIVRHLPAHVMGYLEEWLLIWRRSQAPQHGGLWLAKGGRAPDSTTLYAAMVKGTEPALGFRISPHDFRDAAATTVVENRPAAPRLATIVLDHRSEVMTRNYTEKANQIGATRSCAEIVEVQREKTSRLVRQITRSTIALNARRRDRRHPSS
ncbi:MAG TPA: site-specific integrase [Dongiaceae bacterium]|nr:site-specific integrase [Dongiaceae bacterium]